MGFRRACPTTSATTPSASSSGRNASATGCRSRISHYRCRYADAATRVAIVVAVAHTADGERCLTRARASANRCDAECVSIERRRALRLDAAAGRAMAGACRVGRCSARSRRRGCGPRRNTRASSSNRRRRSSISSSCCAIRDRLVLDLARVERSDELAALAVARAAGRPVHRRDSRRPAGGRLPAHRARSQERDPAAGVRAQARRRVRPPARHRSVSAERRRSADGAARPRARRHARRLRRRRPPTRRRAIASRRQALRTRRRRGESPSRSIPATAARIPARSAGAAPTRRTWCSRSRAS